MIASYSGSSSPGISFLADVRLSLVLARRRQPLSMGSSTLIERHRMKPGGSVILPSGAFTRLAVLALRASSSAPAGLTALMSKYIRSIGSMWRTRS